MNYKIIILLVSLIMPFGINAEESGVPRTSDIDKKDTVNLGLINDTKSYFVNYCIYESPQWELRYDDDLAFLRSPPPPRHYVLGKEIFTLKVPKFTECPKNIEIEHSDTKDWQISDMAIRMLQVESFPH